MFMHLYRGCFSLLIPFTFFFSFFFTNYRWWHLISPIRLHWTWKCQSLQPIWNWGCSWWKCHVTPLMDRLLVLRCKLWAAYIHTQTHIHCQLDLPIVCVTLPLQYCKQCSRISFTEAYLLSWFYCRQCFTIAHTCCRPWRLWCCFLWCWWEYLSRSSMSWSSFTLLMWTAQWVLACTLLRQTQLDGCDQITSHTKWLYDMTMPYKFIWFLY